MDGSTGDKHFDEDYPQIFQDVSQENLCVPICIFIVLEILRRKMIRIPDLSIDEIAEIVGTEPDGTPLGYNIENINEKLKTTVPSVEFKIDFLVPRWRIICDDLSPENPLIKPVIMAILQYDTLKKAYMKHTVVLLKADDRNVIYFDPIYGEIEEPTNQFYSKWTPIDRFCIRLKIGERPQRILEEFNQKDRKGEGF